MTPGGPGCLELFFLLTVNRKIKLNVFCQITRWMARRKLTDDWLSRDCLTTDLLSFSDLFLSPQCFYWFFSFLLFRSSHDWLREQSSSIADAVITAILSLQQINLSRKRGDWVGFGFVRWMKLVKQAMGDGWLVGWGGKRERVRGGGRCGSFDIPNTINENDGRSGANKY